MKNNILLYKPEKLKKHYQNIFDQNKEILLQGGKGDEYLLEPDKDTRMALTLIIRVKECTEQIEAYMGKLKEIEPDLYYYPKSDLHITVLDILRGIPNRQLPDNLKDYVACIEECAKKVHPFDIMLQGTTLSDNAVLINGYYEEGLEKMRQILRKNLRENSLELEERYETFSSHVSVARIKSNLKKPDAFVEKALTDEKFGKIHVNEVEIVFHNWYDSKKQVLTQIKLGNT